MSHKTRLQKLESQQPQRPTWKQLISDEAYNRSMEALAAALGDMTGETPTASEAEQAIKELNHEQP